VTSFQVTFRTGMTRTMLAFTISSLLNTTRLEGRTLSAKLSHHVPVTDFPYFVIVNHGEQIVGSPAEAPICQ
jgi:hypothetical protein